MRAAALLLLVQCATGARAQCAAPSGTDPSCAGYVYPGAAMDVKMLCGMMPGMVGCELAKACDGKSSSSGFCHPFSLLADICASDKGDMGGMHGCSTYTTLCTALPSNSTVRECTRAGAPVPHFVTMRAARDATVSMCSSMPAMLGCTSPMRQPPAAALTRLPRYPPEALR